MVKALRTLTLRDLIDTQHADTDEASARARRTDLLMRTLQLPSHEAKRLAQGEE